MLLPGDLEKKQNRPYRNRSGTVKIRPPWTYFPKNETEITQIVNLVRAQKATLRPAGAGHAASALNETPHSLLFLDRMQGLVHVSTEKREAIVWAGTPLSRLNQLLAEQKLALPYPADHANHTLGGALALGAHGSSRKEGSLASRVIALTLVTGRGDITVCSPLKNPDLFRAALLSLGALGIVTKVSLRLAPLAVVREEMRRLDWNAGLDAIQNRDAADFSELVYFPHTDQLVQRNLYMEGTPPEKTGAGAGALRRMPGAVLAGASSLLPALAKPLAPVAAALFYRAEARLSADVLTAGVAGGGIEYGVDVKKAGAALIALRALFETQRIKTLLPVSLQFAPKDETFLSPANGRDTVYIGVRVPGGAAGQELQRACERRLLDHGGRPAWFASFLENLDFANLFPGRADFTKARETLDPDGVFLNTYLKKVLG